MVGNPANTNALIAQSNAPDVPRERFTAMTRLDHNRAIAQLAQKTGAEVADITNMGVWGNHSPTMFPDLFNAKVGGKNAAEAVDDMEWYENDFLPTRRQARRGDHRGARRVLGRLGRQRRHRPRPRLGRTARADGDWVSMAVPSDGSYGVDEGLISSFPCRCDNGEWEIVQGLEVNDFAKEKIEATVNELREERDAVAKLDLI